jgi:hypothetical protein
MSARALLRMHERERAAAAGSDAASASEAAISKLQVSPYASLPGHVPHIGGPGLEYDSMHPVSSFLLCLVSRRPSASALTDLLLPL